MTSSKTFPGCPVVEAARNPLPLLKLPEPCRPSLVRVHVFTITSGSEPRTRADGQAEGFRLGRCDRDDSGAVSRVRVTGG